MKHEIPALAKKELFSILQERFENNLHRHKKVKWKAVIEKLEKNNAKIWSLNEMEQTGGHPDVIGENLKTGEFIFCDCSPESPIGRRSLCYDNQALEKRKENKPKASAIEMAIIMGIEMLTQEQYVELQKIEKVDLKTSSWILTPTEIRNKGGALFAENRYGEVFTYHNGAESYYASRGFRGLLRV